MAITPNTLKTQNTILVHYQIDRDGVRRETKTRIRRKAYIFSDGLEAFNIWASVPDKNAYRNIASKALTKACIEAFPSNKAKHCSIHCLRHSYAIHMLKFGVSLSHIAQSLGNSVVVFTPVSPCPMILLKRCPERFQNLALLDSTDFGLLSVFGLRSAKAFTDLMLSKDQSLEDISTSLGHTTIERIWRSYKNKQIVKFKAS